MAIQQELTPQTAPEELEELYEEEPRRRPWGAILSVALALAVIFVGYQWQQSTSREHVLASQAHALRADAETLRLRLEEAQREVEGLEKKVAALDAERTTLATRVAALEKVAEQRAASVRAASARVTEQRAAARSRARATPVVVRKSR